MARVSSNGGNYVDKTSPGFQNRTNFISLVAIFLKVTLLLASLLYPAYQQQFSEK